ncbi:hypothetical protein MTO96_052367, partial [Rhipicephalus appendiculatus]
MFEVGCIDFRTSPPTVFFKGLRTAQELDEIKELQDLDERFIYLMHRYPSRNNFDRLLGGGNRNYLRAVGRIKKALMLLTSKSLSEQLVFHSSGPSRLMVVHTADSGPETGDDDSEVVPALRLTYGPGIYRMVLSPRGMCIIINNHNFEYEDEPRHGSQLDVRHMEALFKAFLFNCFVHVDKTADEMKKILSEAAQSKELEGAECLVVILMSHGNRDMIQGVDDEELDLNNDVYAKFNNDICPALRGKPKLFFIQACRGDDWDDGTDAITQDADPRPVPVEEPPLSSPIGQTPLNPWSDMYIAYASIPGYISLRNRAFGSWFLSAVYQVFSEHAGTDHLEQLMKLVHHEVLQRSSDDAALIHRDEILSRYARSDACCCLQCAGNRLGSEDVTNLSFTSSRTVQSFPKVKSTDPMKNVVLLRGALKPELIEGTWITRLLNTEYYFASSILALSLIIAVLLGDKPLLQRYGEAARWKALIWILWHVVQFIT